MTMRKLACFAVLLAVILGCSMSASADSYGSSSFYDSKDGVTWYAPRLGRMTIDKAEAWVARFGGGWYVPNIYQLEGDSIVQASGNDPLSLDKTWTYWASHPLVNPQNAS